MKIVDKWFESLRNERKRNKDKRLIRNLVIFRFRYAQIDITTNLNNATTKFQEDSRRNNSP